MSREFDVSSEMLYHYHCPLCKTYFSTSEIYYETAYCVKCGKLFYANLEIKEEED